ncbi:hypothetical protein FZC66_00760 [Priestia megaterium]|nr:hypothetical protein FZC66_00760 [Priestia megaterium]
MNKNKAILILLLCGFMLYYALPHLVVTTQTLQGIFSVSWLAFALLVIGGNLSSLLYTKRINLVTQQKKTGGKSMRQRG